MRSFTLAASSCRAAMARSSPSTQTVCSKRTFTSLPTLRPSLGTTTPVFRSATATLSRLPNSTPTPTTTSTALSSTSDGLLADILPKSSITSHPAFGFSFQIRCGPRPGNLERTSRLVRKRRVGFLARKRSRTGRKILTRRLDKGKKLTVA